MENKIVKSKVVCPKCKSNSLTLVEVWKDHTITWEQENGEFDRKKGNLEMGDAYRVEAKCECGHQWRIRGALQIDDITV
jgi:RNA polymerase subunit RPABC4/transcription elongation factor Spt4